MTLIVCTRRQNIISNVSYLYTVKHRKLVPVRVLDEHIDIVFILYMNYLLFCNNYYLVPK